MPRPPRSVRAQAKLGLKQRLKFPSSMKPGTRVGVARANQLSRGDNVSERTLKRMSSFARQLGNFKPGKTDPQGRPTKGTVAVRLWGGPEGIRWAQRELKKLEKK